MPVNGEPASAKSRQSLSVHLAPVNRGTCRVSPEKYSRKCKIRGSVNTNSSNSALASSMLKLRSAFVKHHFAVFSNSATVGATTFPSTLLQPLDTHRKKIVSSSTVSSPVLLKSNNACNTSIFWRIVKPLSVTIVAISSKASTRSLWSVSMSSKMGRASSSVIPKSTAACRGPRAKRPPRSCSCAMSMSSICFSFHVVTCRRRPSTTARPVSVLARTPILYWVATAGWLPLREVFSGPLARVAPRGQPFGLALPLSLRGSHDDVALGGPRRGALRLRERISELEFIKILKRVLSRGTILIG